MTYKIATERRLGIPVFYPILLDPMGRLICSYPHLTRLSAEAVIWQVIPKLEGERI